MDFRVLDCGSLNPAVALSCCRCTASLSPCTCLCDSCCTVSLSPFTCLFESSLNLESVSPSCPALTQQSVIEGNSTATRPGNAQTGRRSAVQVVLPPVSLAHLACPAVSALLRLLSATLGLLIPICLAPKFFC